MNAYVAVDVLKNLSLERYVAPTYVNNLISSIKSLWNYYDNNAQRMWRKGGERDGDSVQY